MRYDCSMHVVYIFSNKPGFTIVFQGIKNAHIDTLIFYRLCHSDDVLHKCRYVSSNVVYGQNIINVPV